MWTLPSDIIALLMPFAPLFSPSVFGSAQLLFAGALLTPGQRTVASSLRAIGLSQERHFQNYHRVLNRDQWSPRAAARILLNLLLQVFLPRGPVVLGLDDTIERRRGAKIAAKGIYRDPVRSSGSHFVKTSGLRWLSVMLLVPVPFAKRIWALPFLTALCPSQRHEQQKRPMRRTAKKLTDWARQLLRQVRRWLPERTLVVVADSSFAALELLASWQCPKHPAASIIAVTRLRLDANLYAPPPRRRKGQMGRPRLKGKKLPSLKQRLQDSKTVWTKATVSQWYGRYSTKQPSRHITDIATAHEIEFATGTARWYHSGLPPVPLRWILVRDPKQQFEPQAFLCTDTTIEPLTILSWYARRWAVEVTFREVRDHLGVETQRQWNDKAIARTTPVLLGLFSLVALFAQQMTEQDKPIVRRTAWYNKEQATFADALAWVRKHLWAHASWSFCMSHSRTNKQKLQQELMKHMADLLCYAP